ncbi:MAG: histidine phosphatase family protein [Oscillospiraceae bacterium]|jgi:2,3-bisphosphoglycerate-dependent phosphoglycerate mutase|nr:histidine phosphatase family protein [Oscillospiraceae bacterium]
MTKVYFIRHAESDITIRDPMTRPLTEKGLADCSLVTEFLYDKSINVVLSSPFQRAVDTVTDFAVKNGFGIELINDFRERKSDSKGNWRDDFVDFMKRQWTDFNYSLTDGECLKEVQKRNINALNDVLTRYKNQNIVIGTHGTALSTIVNYYDNTYGFKDFMAMVDIMPWVVIMEFVGNDCVKIEKINLFERVYHE